MKIVIDIPDEVYSYIDRECKELDDGCDSIINHLIHGVLYGTVLPKGHGRLIDEKVAYRKFYARCLGIVATAVFAETPTIIEADKGDAENE